MLRQPRPAGFEPEPAMMPRLVLLALLLGACSPAASPIASDRIERGTALPPPGLVPAAPRN
jgi:hypothetical protein